MDRIKLDPGSAVFDRAAFPDYPYSGKAPYDAIWVTVAELSAGKGEAPERSAPIAWGTLGEYLDANVESGSVGPEEIRDLVADFTRDRRATMAGGVGTGFEVHRIEGPEAAAAHSPAP